MFNFSLKVTDCSVRVSSAISLCIVTHCLLLLYWVRFVLLEDADDHKEESNIVGLFGKPNW